MDLEEYMAIFRSYNKQQQIALFRNVWTSLVRRGSNPRLSDYLPPPPSDTNMAPSDTLEKNIKAPAKTEPPSSTTLPSAESEIAADAPVAAEDTEDNLETASTQSGSSTPSNKASTEDDKFNMDAIKKNPPPKLSLTNNTPPSPQRLLFSTSTKSIPRVRPSPSICESFLSDETYTGQNPPRIYEGSYAHEQNTINKYAHYAAFAETSNFMAAEVHPKQGAHIFSVCSTKELVSTITIMDKCLYGTLTHGKKIGPITDFANFFLCFTPAPSLSINSEDYETFENFYNSCVNMEQWLKNANMVTVCGHYTATMLSNLTTSLRHVYIFQLFRFQLYEKEYFLDEWLALIPDVHHITVDARYFTRCNYHSDFKSATLHLQNGTADNKNITVITTKMVNPAQLQTNITTASTKLKGTKSLVFVTEDPCYQEIQDKLLRELKFIRGSGNIQIRNYENTISSTFWKKYGKATITLGYSIDTPTTEPKKH